MEKDICCAKVNCQCYISPRLCLFAKVLIAQEASPLPSFALTNLNFPPKWPQFIPTTGQPRRKPYGHLEETTSRV